MPLLRHAAVPPKRSAPLALTPTGERAGVPKALVQEALEEVHAQADGALAQIEGALPADFPADINDSVSAGLRAQLPGLDLP